ncbi:hypothetical protein, partial [Mycolicibacterium poriferae]|uniref:hypothetical protein n=1 Tax=Mycolicibacterium poriferae TaxID=39694 RepID=UPI00321BBBA2
MLRTAAALGCAAAAGAAARTLKMRPGYPRFPRRSTASGVPPRSEKGTARAESTGTYELLAAFSRDRG